MNIDDFIEKHGEVINGQVTVAWSARATYDDLVANWEDGGDDPSKITEGDFIEYIRSNTADFINTLCQAEGEVGIMPDIFAVSRDGIEFTQ